MYQHFSCSAFRARGPRPLRASQWRLSNSGQRSMGTHSSRKESIRPQNYYEMFPGALPRGLPPAGPFDLDIPVLRREFFKLQTAAHPDRHPQKDKLKAEAASARLNEAFKTLQDPLLRAQYLLQLRGVDVAEDETAKVEDPELLMEVLDIREAIEDAEDESELKNLVVSNQAKIDASVAKLGKAFEEENIEIAKSEAVKLRYWRNIKESLDNWEKGKPVVIVH